MPKFSLTTLPWKAQLAIFVGLSLAAMGAFYYFLEMPAQAEMQTQQTELDGVRSRINKGLTTARQLPEFRKEVTELEAKLESLKPILPEEKDAADLLRNVNTLAVQSNLTIRGFKPQPITTKQMHAEWPIALELEGTYHNLALFFDRVGKFTRIVNISAVDIRGKERPEPDSTITATCVATTFVLLDKPAPKPGAPAAPAAKPAA